MLKINTASTLAKPLITALLILAANCFVTGQSVTDQTDTFFRWNVETTGKNSTMLLDVPYSRNDIQAPEYMTISISKKKASVRPEFIMFKFPDTVAYTDGLALQFRTGKNTTFNWLRIEFNKNSDHIITVEILNGYYMDKRSKTKTDIWDMMMKNDYMICRIQFPDHRRKLMIVPLVQFQKQYYQLK